MEESEPEPVPTSSANESGNETTVVSPPPTPAPTIMDDKENMEERYNKLKAIAVRLKKKINEQNEEIQLLEKEKSKYQNASKIQLEFDKAQDEVEKLRAEKKVLQKDVQIAVDENVRLKMQTLEDSTNIQNLTSSHKVLREKVEKLEKDLLESEHWKSQAETMGKELKDAKDAEANAEQEKRQSAILSLEITDYEKKLQDLHKHLEEKKAEVDALRADLSKRSNIVEEVQKNLQTSKDSAENLTRVKESLQADVQRKLEKISFLQDEMNKLKEKLSEKNLDYIKLEQEYENSKLTFASQSKDLVEKCDSLQRMIATLEHKISVLEENKRSRESHIANLKLEIQQMESEYSNYKTKAQAMLKSQRSTNVNTEQQSDELENLQKIIQNFQSDIAILKTDLQTMQLENDNLAMEKSELGLRFNQMKTDTLEKEVRFNNELQKAKQESRQKDDLFKIRVEEMEKSNATAYSLLEVKLESTKSAYEDKLLKLQEQLDTVSYNNYDLKNAGASNTDPLISCKSTFRPIGDGDSPLGPDLGPDNDVTFNHHSQPLTIDTSNLSFEQLRMLPRGECEGSESIGSAFTPRVSVDNYMSFEQLLSSSLDSSSKHGLDGDGAKAGRDGVNFKEELVRSQNQVSHLTALLRESESNCERLSQLSDALKEEIRRVEREQERKEHLKENTEYLKNVLLKFMTLNGEDERRRLIPVMKTMLQLTNDEVGRLENNIKGKDSGQSRDNGSAGWTGYLSMLTGADK